MEKLFLFALLLSSCLASSLGCIVDRVPGQPKVTFKQYAGQVTVNKNESRVLFYWFFEADHPNASSLPLVLWLNGGPGCSAVGNGALGELGPFRVNKDGKTLSLNDYAWTKEANIIFLESPAGVGYAYTPDLSASIQNDAKTVADNMEFLFHFFNEFPQYRNNDFYLTGESYAGHYIPTLAVALLNHNAQKPSSYINLKGVAIGNPWTDASIDGPSTIDFYYTHSIISEELYETLKNCSSCNIFAGLLLGNVNVYDILEDKEHECVGSLQRFTYEMLHQKSFGLKEEPKECNDPITYYLNTESVRAALHVRTRQPWIGCARDIPYSTEDREQSMLPLYHKLIKSGLKIWIYSGDMDSVVATPGTRNWIKTLNLNITVPWFPWRSHDSVGGWGQVYDGLTFATVRGAGHMVPTTQPLRGLDLFRAFLSDNLPQYWSWNL